MYQIFTDSLKTKMIKYHCQLYDTQQEKENIFVSLVYTGEMIIYCT